MGSLAGRLIRGAVAGLAATGPMTIFMVLAHRRLPRSQQYELPPATITDAALCRLGIAEQVPAPSQEALSIANHFAYGAAAGAVYGLFQEVPPGPTTRAGSCGRAIAYAMGVWTGSYLGWLPAAGVHRSALREPLARNVLMITAHVIWGAGLALVDESLKNRSETMKGRANASATDSYTIIHKVEGRPPETVASGLNLDQARQWLERKAAERGAAVTRDLVIGKSSDGSDANPGESWHAAKAE
jgi:hypothetical protein